MQRAGNTMPLLWQAHYTDGTTLYQRGPDGKAHGYGDIDRKQLVAFDLWQGDQLCVRVDFRPDDSVILGPKRLIWRVRHFLDTAGRDEKVHLVGWQRRISVGGSVETVQSIAYVFEDGSVVLGGQWAGGDVFYPVVPLECEK